MNFPRPYRRFRCERAGVLVATMIFGGVVGAILLSYLVLLQSRSLVRARSQAWNAAIPLLDSGIEEAFTHLWADYPVIVTNGWTNEVIAGQTVVSKRRNFSDGSYTYVTLYNALSNNPVIYSTGFIPAPLGQGYIARTVQVSTTNPPAFTKAIAAKGLITLTSHMLVDSFDSTSSSYSTGGAYDPAKHRANAAVVTDSSANPAISVGIATILGPVRTGPGGIVSVGGGAVGDLAWVAGHSGVEPGFSTDDMNVTYPDNIMPTGAASWPTLASGSYSYSGTNYTYSLGNANYSISSLAMGSGQSLVVTGKATLYVSGSVSITGGAYIYIAPGGNLQLYVAGPSADISGGGVMNANGNAANFAYYGLPGNTSINFAGNAALVGTINAPNADLALTGGSDIYGAVVVKTFTGSSSGASLHYDEGLARVLHLRLLTYREQ